MQQRARHRGTTAAGATAWQVVIGFGLVSLFADMVYEGARAITGPLLGQLGASALVVGLVTGAGEATALVLRLVSGPLADRTGRYWSLTLLGYGLTAVCVPLLAITPLVGAAGLGLAITLILLERTGKAIRSPSKTALLADAAGSVGRGRGFGVHKFLDELGAIAGPLLVSVLIATTGTISPAMAWLAVPGAIAIAVLFVLRIRVPDTSVFEEQPRDVPPRPGAPSPTDGPAPSRPTTAAAPGSPAGSAAPGARGWTRNWWGQTFGSGLPRRFFLFSGCSALATGGLVTFGVISFHLVQARVLPLAAVPVVYAAGQGASALAALATGHGYDRWGPRVLYVLPVLVALVPVLAFTWTPWVALLGVLAWGAANGLQDSTVKALVADLVGSSRRATAYGVFAAIQGAAAIAGGTLAGWLYDTSLPTLVAVVAASQVGTALLLRHTLADGR
ncbi:Major Facilitator Superfamily protein [Raineyella antarctica]|uniref:Major Facilitator Superfamily protein n=1 Tax=Raineyella antarctica TaxID=1577474 RepID=A0A1G6GDG2_9ACTN|nr:MFS transporter [Raineyella antarctica]SDB80031.1 Major Facilitator Superfamily protein [Raineyella antarctica]